MDSILETLETADPKTLAPQFNCILSPFSDLVKHPRSGSKPPSRSHLRPLAKRFLPFLSQSIKLVPSLLRRGSPTIATDRAAELFTVYRLILDCFAIISPCLVGNSSFVEIERGALVCCLEAWGRYDEAEEEGVGLVGRWRTEMREEALGKDIGVVAVKVVACVVGCAAKRKAMDGDVYSRNLRLVEWVSSSVVRCKFGMQMLFLLF